LFAWRYQWKAIWPVIATVLGFALADLASVHLFKDVFERLRPCHDPEIKHLVHIVNNDCGGFYGFVSSHAANTFAIATVTSALFRNRYFSIWIFFWAALLSFSRIYLGRHFPADIVCGGLLGIAIGFAIFRIYRMIPLTRNLYGKKS
jgi:undecaprenyl-diphosphatase